jgi:RHS repeat-associated protein
MVVFCVFGAYGVPSMRYEGTSTNNHLHLGLEWQSMKGLYGYYNNARFRDPLLAGMFYQQDPLAEKYYPYTPYHYGANNPNLYYDINGMDIWNYQ